MQIQRKINWLTLSFVCLFLCLALYFAIALKKRPKAEEITKSALLSEIHGYEAWESERRITPSPDVQAFIRGVLANAQDAPPPNTLSPREMYDLSHEVAFELHQKKNTENLQRSKEFLSAVSKKPGITTLIENLLYYELLSEGKGPPVIKSLSSTYSFHYTVSIPENDELFDTRKMQRPQKICLDCVISGFVQGILGMREGERRKLYIHPELGFRTMHWTVPPSTVLIIDVELVKAEREECSSMLQPACTKQELSHV